MIEKNGKKRYVLNWCIWALYTVIIVFLTSRHEPWGDEYHVWSMSYRMSLGEIWNAMRIEGHFSLWHYMVAFWVKLFNIDWHALYIVSLSLMSAAAWFLLFKVRFPLLGKLFLIFSSPFIYDFPVIARCYALIPPIVIGLVIAYQNKKPFLFCILLGLLANTHAYMEGMVAALWIVYAYEEVIRKWRTDHQWASKCLWYSLITIILVIIAFIQVGGGIQDAANGVGPAIKSAQSPESWLTVFFNRHRIYLTGFLRKHSFSWIPEMDLIFTLTIAIASVCAVYSSLRCKGRHAVIYLFIILVSCGWQIIFSLNIYAMAYQRVYLMLIPVIMLLAISPQRHIYQNAIVLAVACIFALNSSHGIFTIWEDITNEYSQDLRCSRQVDSIIPADKAIYYIMPDSGAISFFHLLKKDIHEIEDTEDVSSLESDSYLITLQELSQEDYPTKTVKPLFKGHYQYLYRPGETEYYVYKVY